MVGEIRAHRRQVEPDVEPVLAQVRGRADARQHQQLRRVVRAGAEHHLALGAQRLRDAVAHDLGPDRAVALEQQPGHGRTGHEREVRARERRMQVGDRGRAAHPVSLRELVEADAVLPAPVEVGVRGQAGLDRRLDPGARELVIRARVGDAQRPARAVQRVCAALVVLGALEVRQHLVPAPARAPARRSRAGCRACRSSRSATTIRPARARAARRARGRRGPARDPRGNPSRTACDRAGRTPPGCGAPARSPAARPPPAAR